MASTSESAEYYVQLVVCHAAEVILTDVLSRRESMSVCSG